MVNAALTADDAKGWRVMDHLFDYMRRLCAVTQVDQENGVYVPDAFMKTANAGST